MEKKINLMTKANSCILTLNHSHIKEITEEVEAEVVDTQHEEDEAVQGFNRIVDLDKKGINPKLYATDVTK